MMHGPINVKHNIQVRETYVQKMRMKFNVTMFTGKVMLRML